MSDIKLIGGDTSSTLMKITRKSILPIRFKPDFKEDYTPEEIDRFVDDKIRLWLYKLPFSDPKDFINKGNLKDKVQMVKTGEELIFKINTDIDKKTVEDHDILLARIVELPKDAKKKEVGKSEETSEDEKNNKKKPPLPSILAEMVFQVIPVEAASPENTLFNLLNTLPSDLQNLKDVKVALKRSDRDEEPDAKLWDMIKGKTDDISFKKYEEFMTYLCEGNTEVNKVLKEGLKGQIETLSGKRWLPFTDTDGYRTVKVLTEAFLLYNCTIDLESNKGMEDYLEQTSKEGLSTLPLLNNLRARFNDLDIKVNAIGDILDMLKDGSKSVDQNCYGILKNSLVRPCFIELIWNYWHEESMMVQSLSAISRRFQNVRSGSRDPLANLEIAPLRPLNNLLWGYIQDEQHRLSITRRAYEYDHHYGFTLKGKAIPTLNTADSRTNFLEAFHQLLNLCIKFYKEDDDTTVIADGFPILNALREVHLILSEGMHNQYGDLPFTSRVEMMSQQWLLARPEFREFLPTRNMVAYPENWMSRVAAMNTLQGWTGSSPVHFSKLGIYGEKILLAIRFGHWNDTGIDGDQAAIWATAFRNEIQGYVHSYRAVTGIDLTNTSGGKINAAPPSLHLQRRLQAQKRAIRAN